MAKWKIREKSADATGLEGIHPAVSRLLVRRGIDTREKMERFFFPDYDRDIHDPFLFSDMERAVERVSRARDDKENVLVYGDYDADGITSSAILAEALENIGLRPEVYIPSKMLEGYGINMEAAEKFIAEGVKLILTVDCGISNREEIQRLKDGGVDVIVIDHHHVPPEIPPAYAIINPKMADSKYPFDQLAGVGVTFKFVQAIYGKFIPQKTSQLKWMLDLVGIGTIADCVPLMGENRLFAKYGLIVLSKTRRVGLQELFKIGRLYIDENNVPGSWNVSFQIAPRINAAGRIDHAKTAFQLVKENDRVRANGLALEVEAKNQERQKVTSQVVEEVKKIADNMFSDKKFIYAVGEHYPIGVVGLVAGKIAKEFNRPAAVFQKKDGKIKGSFRSIPQLNIIEAIEDCKDLLKKYGGHAQAAGVSLEADKADRFFRKMEGIIEKRLEGVDVSPVLEIDQEITAGDLGFELAEHIRKMEPFGEGNPEPVFLIRGLEVADITYVGNGEKHLKLFLKAGDGSPKIFEAIGFGMAQKNDHIRIGAKVDIVFTLQIDHWNGSRKISLRMEDLNLAV